MTTNIRHLEQEHSHPVLLVFGALPEQFADTQTTQPVQVLAGLKASRVTDMRNAGRTAPHGGSILKSAIHAADGSWSVSKQSSIASSSQQNGLRLQPWRPLFSGLLTPAGAAVPPNVHLLTLQRLPGGDSILLRLAHMYQSGENPQLSQAVQLDPSTLFEDRGMCHRVTELSLFANEYKADMPAPVKWETARNITTWQPALPQVKVYDVQQHSRQQHLQRQVQSKQRLVLQRQPSAVIELYPMEIRTFECHSAQQHGSHHASHRSAEAAKASMLELQPWILYLFAPIIAFQRDHHCTYAMLVISVLIWVICAFVVYRLRRLLCYQKQLLSVRTFVRILHDA